MSSQKSNSSSTKKGSALQSLASGALAGGIARTCTAPIDRVRILYQTSATRRFTLANAWKTCLVIFRDEGVLGFYRGNGASVVRVAPYAATIFTTFDVYEGILNRAFKPDTTSSTTRFCAGSLAGMTAVTLTYPLDVLRARIAADWGQKSRGPRPRGSIWARTIRDCLQEKGFRGLSVRPVFCVIFLLVSSAVKAVTPYVTGCVPSRGGWECVRLFVHRYAGLRPTLVGVVPYAGLNFAIYEGLKDMVVKRHAAREAAASTPTFLSSLVSDGRTGVYVNLSCGALAGLVAQTATYPLHVLRRRQQVKIRDSGIRRFLNISRVPPPPPKFCVAVFLTRVNDCTYLNNVRFMATKMQRYKQV